MLPQAAHNGIKLTVLDVGEHDDVGPTHDDFGGLLFVPEFDDPAKRKPTHFVCACYRQGDKSRAEITMRRSECGMDGVDDGMFYQLTRCDCL